MPTVFLVDPASPGDGPLHRLFHGAGYYVVDLTDGDEAVAALAALSPDLLVVDANRAAAGAVAWLATTLRDDPRSRTLPLIVLNARPDDVRLRGLVRDENVFVAGDPVDLRKLLHLATRQLARPRSPAPIPPTDPPLASAR